MTGESAGVEVETQVVLLAEQVRAVLASLTDLTAELRRTNETVQTLHADARLANEKLERVNRELWTLDSASRIRACELHIRGLYALVAFVAVVMGGQLIAVLMHWGWPGVTK